MAKKNVADTQIVEIKKSLEAGKIIVGTDRTLGQLRHGKLKKAFLSSNCPEAVVQDIERLAQLTETEVVTLTVANDELGTICKKPFSISVLGLLK